MRIETLEPDGFGVFAQRRLGPLSGGLAVLVGPNEAGKTTLLQFIRTVLFGFPARGADAHYPALRGGRHGGRLALASDDGMRFVAERFRGPRGGDLAVRDDAGLPLDHARLKGLLDPANRGVFESVFAFRLDELEDLGSLQGEQVSGRIYGASMGAANLPSAVGELETRAKDVFAPRGRSHAVARTLAELGQADAALEEAATQAAEYGRLVERRATLEARLACLAEVRERLLAGARNLERLRRAWDDWAPLRGLEAELAELPRFDAFPEDAVPRLEGLVGKTREATDALSSAETDLRRMNEAIAAPVPDAGLLGEEEVIGRAERQLGSFEESILDLPERQAELAQREEALRATLRNLGPDWDEQRLDVFEVSMALRHEIDGWRRRLDARATATHDRATDLTHVRRQHQEASEVHRQREEDAGKVPRPGPDGEALNARQRQLIATRSRLTDLARARDRRRDLDAQLEQAELSRVDQARTGPGALLFPGLVVAAGGAALVAALAVGGQEVAMLLGLVLLAVGLSALVRRWAPRGAMDGEVSPTVVGLRQLAERAHEEEARAESALRASAEPLGLGLPESDALDTAEADVTESREALRRWAEAQRRTEDAAQAVQSAARSVQQAEDASGEALHLRQAEQDAWHQWLGARGLPATMAPETVAELLGRVEAARAEHRQVRDWRHRVEAIQTDIEQYRALVGPVMARHDLGADDVEPSRLLVLAEGLIERYHKVRDRALRRASDQEGIVKLTSGVDLHRQRIAHLRRELADLVAVGGAADAEDLRRRAAQHSRRAELEREVKERQGRLRQACRNDETLEDVASALSLTSLEDIEAGLARAGEEGRATDAERSGLDQEHGANQARLEQLALDEAASGLRARREVLLERLRSQAEEWSRLVLAQALLRRTREKYERERQPGVVRHAESLFNTVTGGRYQRIVIPLGTHEVAAVEHGNPPKTAAQLSRGTREQLYLALRFGLVREFGERGERLPVVVDEVLVNFDPVRARKVAAGFVELSRTNQVLVFTCHPWVVDVFREADPSVQVVDLDAAGGQEAQPRLV